MNRFFAALTALSAAASPLLAGPLQEARVNQVVNDVKVIEPQRGAHPARLQEVIKDDLAVHTGIQSRAELLFQDATLTRLGAETFFSFKAGTRDIDLERGTLLLQVPKNLGGARIRAASVTASITGTTIMIEHRPGKSLKVVVLEGSLRLGLSGRVGETLLLTPGKMVIMNPEAKRIPEPVNVDLRKLMKTSALIDPKTFAGKSKARIAELPSLPLIEKEVGRQETLIQKKGLIATNLVIEGSGTNVVAATDESLARLDQNGLAADAKIKVPEARSSQPVVTTGATSQTAATRTNEPAATTVASAGQVSASPTGASPKASDVLQAISDFVVKLAEEAKATIAANNSGNHSEKDDKDHDKPGKKDGDDDEKAEDLKPVALTLDGTMPAIDVTGATVVAASSIPRNQGYLATGVDGSGTVAPTAGGRLNIQGYEIKIGDGPAGGINLDGGGSLLAPGLAGGDGGTLIMGTSNAPIYGDVEIKSPITARTGANASGVATGGLGGAVQIVTQGKVKIESPISVSSAASGSASASGGVIAIQSSREIKIENSGQLLSLLDAAAPGPGGTIKIRATGGNVTLSGSRVQADRGTVEIGAAGSSSRITLSNTTIAGDVVKIGALGANGQLTIGGGTISADTMLKLYAGTTDGSVRFTANTTLGGAGTKLIAGRSVTIDDHRTVTIGGSARATVFTDHANYTGSGGNGSTSGKFGGAGAITKPFARTPSF